MDSDLVGDRGLGWQLLESAPDATVVVGEDGIIRYVNRRTEAVFGYTATDLIGQPVEILIPDRMARNHPDFRQGYFATPYPRPMGAEYELAARRK